MVEKKNNIKNNQFSCEVNKGSKAHLNIVQCYFYKRLKVFCKSLNYTYLNVDFKIRISKLTITIMSKMIEVS